MRQIGRNQLVTLVRAFLLQFRTQITRTPTPTTPRREILVFVHRNTRRGERITLIHHRITTNITLHRELLIIQSRHAFFAITHVRISREHLTTILPRWGHQLIPTTIRKTERAHPERTEHPIDRAFTSTHHFRFCRLAMTTSHHPIMIRTTRRQATHGRSDRLIHLPRTQFRATHRHFHTRMNSNSTFFTTILKTISRIKTTRIDPRFQPRNTFTHTAHRLRINPRRINHRTRKNQTMQIGIHRIQHPRRTPTFQHQPRIQSQPFRFILPDHTPKRLTNMFTRPIQHKKPFFRIIIQKHFFSKRIDRHTTNTLLWFNRLLTHRHTTKITRPKLHHTIFPIIHKHITQPIHTHPIRIKTNPKFPFKLIPAPSRLNTTTRASALPE